MGKKDEVLRKYLADNKRYADLINGFALNGQQIIKAEDIFALDSRTEVKNRTKEKSKYRDAIRCTAFGTNFAVIGVENQNEVDYLMPLRCMGYDVREYERQAAMWRKQVRRQKKITGAEFLSGFRKCDRLHPCITFVLYYGDEWDGSRDLVGMLDCQGMPEELRMLVNNYKIHLIDVKRLENTEVFQTDLRQVFDFVRFSGGQE